MFKLVRVLENVQLKGAKGWMNEGVRGKEESDDIQQCILKNEKKSTQCKPALTKYVYLKLTLRWFNTEQDSFRNIKQAILHGNVSKCPKFHVSSDWQEIVKIILLVK